MSIEKLIEENTAALNRLAAVMEKGVAAGAAKAAAGKPTDKPADKPADKPSGKPSGKPAASKPKAGPTQDEVAEKVTAYLKGVTDKAERDERKDHVRQIIEYYGAEKFTAIDADKYAEALSMLDDFEAGNTPALLADPDNEGGEDGDGDDDNMV